MKTSADISVIIPTFNGWGTIKKTLVSLLKQTAALKEIIVVDNGSTDGTAQNIKDKFPGIKVVSLKENTGVSGGRNKGIESAHGSYLFFFDHDMIADQKMLEELMITLNRDSRIGIVTPKIYYLKNKKRIWSAGTSINLWSGQVTFRGGLDEGQFEEEEEIQIAPAAILIKKNVIKKIGQFSDSYFAVFEDSEFCLRVKKAGFKVMYAPKAVAYHDLSMDQKDEAERLLDRSFWIGRNRVLFMRSFGKSFLIFIFFLPFYLLYYLILALREKRLTAWFIFLKGTATGFIGK